MSENWQQARLIPVAGTSTGREREQRATSALLAVLSVVRPFSVELLSPLGASRAGRARVEAFIETSHKSATKGVIRPDGLIRVTYGNQPPWTALVEVKTGTNELTLEQINTYIDCARQHRYDHVITISNEIAPSDGVHPTEGLRVAKNSRVKVTHLSWTRVAAIATRVKERIGVDDETQDWILEELMRYLEHQSSGALEFDDMGPHWTQVRDEARKASLRRGDEGTLDIARRWDQLLTFASLKLGVQIGAEVQELLPKSHRDEPSARSKDFARQLSEAGVLTGELRVPETVGDIEIRADLRARQLSVGTLMRAPHDKRARGSISWILKQLAEAPAATELESIARNFSAGETVTVGELREDSAPYIARLPADIYRFRVTSRAELGMARRGGRGPGFVDSVLDGVSQYYRTTHQHLIIYAQRAPQVTEKGREAAERELGSVGE